MILANSDNPHEGFLLRVEAVLIVSVACAKKLYLLKHILNFVRSQTLFLYPLTTASQGGAEGCARVRSYRPKEPIAVGARMATRVAAPRIFLCICDFYPCKDRAARR